VPSSSSPWGWCWPNAAAWPRSRPSPEGGAASPSGVSLRQRFLTQRGLSATSLDPGSLNHRVPRAQ
jgi:hypothetical protein